MKRYVLDASALLAFFERRAGANQVEGLFQHAAESEGRLLLSVINWGEVYYSVWRMRGEAAANQKLTEIAQLPIELVDVDMETAKLAAALQAKTGLAYVDCFVAALAQERNAALVTTDRDFAAVEAKVPILWAAKG